MLDSIYVAASGLTGHQKGLKTISNNVANMNTPGFKGSSTQFTDVFLQEAGDHQQSSSNNAGGGLNTLAPTINFQSGEIRSTGRDLDEALDGPGFFVVRKEDGQQLYTKAGRFEINAAGQLVTMDGGYEVLGHASGGSQDLSPLSMDNLRLSQFKGTTNVTFSGNLSTTAGSTTTTGPDHTIDNVTVYDAMGTAHTLKFEFTVKRQTSTTSTTTTLVPEDWTVKVLEGTQTVGTGELKTASGGADPLADRFTLTLTALNSQTSNISVVLGSHVTAFSGGTSSTLVKESVDGNAAGTVTKTAIDSTGALVVTYSNTLTAKAGQLAVAEFITPEVLSRAGGTLFEYSGDDPVRIVELGSSTKLVSGSLELSNIDLTDQFSTMILVQRGFQASSQVLSTASEMIQSLYDIKSHR